MKRLIVFRHGNYQNQELTIRAAKEVYARAKLIGEFVGQADLILTSPALRAEQTALVIAKAMGEPDITEEPLLNEKYGYDKDLFEEKILDEVADSGYRNVVVVTHYPNICRMFKVGLEPGMEIILEAQEWKNIFEGRPSNLSTKIPDHRGDALEQYYAPRCCEKDLQKLDEIDFLHDRIL